MLGIFERSRPKFPCILCTDMPISEFKQTTIDGHSSSNLPFLLYGPSRADITIICGARILPEASEAVNFLSMDGIEVNVVALPSRGSLDAEALRKALKSMRHILAVSINSANTHLAIEQSCEVKLYHHVEVQDVQRITKQIIAEIKSRFVL